MSALCCAFVCLAVMAGAEGGYRYATLAEPIYGLKLTRETVGRKALPTIRKKEARAGGAIAGISNFFFFDQLDKAYTENIREVLETHRLDYRIIVNRAIDRSNPEEVG